MKGNKLNYYYKRKKRKKQEIFFGIINCVLLIRQLYSEIKWLRSLLLIIFL